MIKMNTRYTNKALYIGHAAFSKGGNGNDIITGTKNWKYFFKVRTKEDRKKSPVQEDIRGSVVSRDQSKPVKDTSDRPKLTSGNPRTRH
jgi:hypothetical protein